MQSDKERNAPNRNIMLSNFKPDEHVFPKIVQL